jgi:uncharacterized repeat protein (TIGR01451 family)
VTGPDGTTTEFSNCASKPKPNLSVTLDDDREVVGEGEGVHYTLTVSNATQISASGIVLQQTLPAGATFGQAIPTTGTCTQAAGVVTCQLGSLQSFEGQPAGWLGYEDDHDVFDPSDSAEVPLRPEVRAIAAHDLYTCAIFTDGRLACWGAGYRPLGTAGQKHVGDDPGEIQDLTPLAFGTDPSPVKTVSPGKEHACATLTDGTAWCWGVPSNQPQHGELGIGPVPNGPYAEVAAGLVAQAADINAGPHRRLLETYATGLATGLASLVSVLDPELVVLSGASLTAGGEPLRALVQAELEELAAARPRLVVGDVREHPVLRGALESALATTRDEVFDTSR